MLKFNLMMNKETGDLVTYSQAVKEFYKTPRGYLECVWDAYVETDIESDEDISFPDFLNLYRK